MPPSLTDTLCTRCGLCCDGSLFADVELASRSEAAGLVILGLAIDDDADTALLSQPCTALAGTRCSIYAHRPGCCRTFECRLLRDTRRGRVSVEQAQAHIARARARIRRVEALLARLRQRDAALPLRERCAEALSGGAAASPEVTRTRAALERAMSEVEALLRQRFL